MHRLTRLLILASFVVCWLGCGVSPEPVADTVSALNGDGHSIPPAGGWAGKGPWVCIGSNPMSVNWPTPTWCQWQPAAGQPTYPWNVQPCSGPAPQTPGTVWVYQYANYGGSCAQIANAFNTSPYGWDVDLMEVNGYLTYYEGSWESIGSYRVAPSTAFTLCEGPLSGANDTLCSLYRQIGGLTQAQGVNYPSTNYSDGSAFRVAAIVLSATHS